MRSAVVRARAASGTHSVEDCERTVRSHAVPGGRAIARAMVLLLLASSLLSVVISLPQDARALTLYVGGGGPGSYTTIQAAVNVANAGDTVYVFSGTYRESVTVTRSISLVGEDRNDTIIDGLRANRALSIAASGVRVSGFTITNGNQAVYLYSVTGCTIADTVISNSYSGVSLTSVTDSTIVGNIVSSNSGNGIELSSSANNSIVGNIVTSNGNNGISLYASVGNNITDNIASSNQRGIVLDSSSSNTIARNTAISNYDQYNPYGAGIYLVSSSSNAILDNNVSSNEYGGIRFEFSARNDVRGNTVSSNDVGIRFLSSSVNLVQDNEVTWNYDGISFTSSSTNTLIGNSIASNNGGGMNLYSSGNNTLMRNSIASNRYTGIRLSMSSGNRMFHNNIGGNGQQAQDDSENAWDDGYPSGGNYWSDYDGVDLRSGPSQDLPGSDGIGDTLHYIPYGASVDRYPRVDPNAAPLSPPSQPLNLTATPGNGQVAIAWEAPTYDGGSLVLNYRIYRRISYYSEEYIAQIGDVRMFLDTGLTNGETHTYRVAARNLVGEGLRSNEARAVPATVPGPPLGLAAVAESRLVTLSWIPPDDDGGSTVTNFLVYRGTSPAAGVLLAEVGTVVQYVDLGLTNGVTYYYAVAAKNAVGGGARSEEVAATPAAVVTVPGPPVRLAAAAGNEEVTLSWSAPADNGGSPITNYVVYRGPFNGGEAFLVEIGNVLTYRDTGLTNGQTYFFRVAAKTIVGEGAKSDSVSALPLTIPGAPVALSVTPGDGQATLAWFAPVDDGGSLVTHYSVYRGLAPGAGVYLTTAGAALTFRDVGLTNGATHYYQITASNVMGEGPRSTEVSVTPTAPPPNQRAVCTIADPTPDAVISGRYSIMGSASDADGTVERVDVRVDGSGWMEAFGTTSWSYELDTTLYSSGRHTVYVRAFDGTDFSPLASVSVTVRNDATTPDIPVVLQGWFWGLVVMAVVIVALVALYLRERRRPRARPRPPAATKTENVSGAGTEPGTDR